jgi:hypothetical protein
MAWSLLSWGMISFAVATIGLRVQDRWFGAKQYHPTREHMEGARRRKRRSRR